MTDRADFLKLLDRQCGPRFIMDVTASKYPNPAIGTGGIVQVISCPDIPVLKVERCVIRIDACVLRSVELVD